MYEQMHILSPLVRPREFNIIRYCKQVDAGVWMITDMSIDSSQPNTTPLCQSWKHPSGCIIRELPHGACLVSIYILPLISIILTLRPIKHYYKKKCYDMFYVRLLGLNMWKWKIRSIHTLCIDMLSVTLIYMELKAGLRSFKECAKDLSAFMLKLYLIKKLQEVSYIFFHYSSFRFYNVIFS